MGRTGRASALTIAAIVMLATGVSGAEPVGISFDQVGPVSVSASTGAPDNATTAITEVRFALINGWSTSAVIKLFAVSSSGAAESTPLPLAKVTAREAPCATTVPDTVEPSLIATVTVEAGATCAVSIGVDVARPPGTYNGTLVATHGPSGTTDTLPLTIAIAATATKPSFDPARPVLQTPLPDPVTVAAFSRPNVGGSPSIQINPSSVTSVTPLIGADGTLVPTRFVDGILTVPVVPEAGTYTGSLVGTDGKAAAKLTLSVKDWWLLPLLVTALGVLVAFVSQRWVTRIKPEWEFTGRMDTLLRDARDATTREQRLVDDLLRADPPERLAIDIVGPNDTGALPLAIQEALKDFRAQSDPSERDKAYGVGGTKTTQITDIAAAAETARGLGAEATDRYWRLHDALSSPPQVAERFAGSIFTDKAKEVLKGGLFVKSTDLVTARDARKELSDQLAKAVTYIVEAARLRKMKANDGKIAAIEAALAGMIDWEERDWETVQTAEDAARSSIPIVRQRTASYRAFMDEVTGWERIRATDLFVWPQIGREPTASDAGAPAAGRAATSSPIGARANAALASLWSRLQPRWLLDRVLAGDRVQVGELLYVAFVFFAAILTGMNTNYLAKATFGSLADYATLFLWGVTAATVIELAKGAWLARLLRVVGG